MAAVTKPVSIGGPEWARLTVVERVTLCHDFAREALQLAETAPPDVKVKYEAMAAEWNELAAEIEQAAHKTP